MAEDLEDPVGRYLLSREMFQKEDERGYRSFAFLFVQIANLHNISVGLRNILAKLADKIERDSGLDQDLKSTLAIVDQHLRFMQQNYDFAAPNDEDENG